MRKVILLLIVLMTATYTVNAENEHFRVNEQAVEQMFMSAENLSFTDYTGLESFTAIDATVAAKSPWVALALNSVYYFTGIAGIHRLYLGSSIGIFIGYFCTGGGCGIIQTIDWVVLLIGALNEDIRKFENNTKFIMF